MSRYFECEMLSNTTNNSIISKRKAIFARDGIPEKDISDNGPQYASDEIGRFSQQWNFTHITSSPRYPLPNEMVCQKNCTNWRKHIDKVQIKPY